VTGIKEGRGILRKTGHTTRDFDDVASLVLPKFDPDPRAHTCSLCNEPNRCPGFFDFLLDVLLDFVLGKIWGRRAQDAPGQARTSDDRLVGFCRVAQAQLQGDRKAFLNPEIANLDTSWPSFTGGSNSA